MMHISITAQVYPGTKIDDAFNESVTLATRVGVPIEFKFNEVSCVANPGGDSENGVREYHEAIQSKRQFKHAFAR